MGRERELVKNEKEIRKREGKGGRERGNENEKNEEVISKYKEIERGGSGRGGGVGKRSFGSKEKYGVKEQRRRRRRREERERRT